MREVPQFSLLKVHSMVTVATVCQSKVKLILLLDGLINGTKTIFVQLKENIFILEWKTTLSRHPQELKNVSVSRAVRLRKLFP